MKSTGINITETEDQIQDAVPVTCPELGRQNSRDAQPKLTSETTELSYMRQGPLPE